MPPLQELLPREETSTEKKITFDDENGTPSGATSSFQVDGSTAFHRLTLYNLLNQQSVKAVEPSRRTSLDMSRQACSGSGMDVKNQFNCIQLTFSIHLSTV
jgi:hypothetical protein